MHVMVLDFMELGYKKIPKKLLQKLKVLSGIHLNMLKHNVAILNLRIKCSVCIKLRSKIFGT